MVNTQSNSKLNINWFTEEYIKPSYKKITINDFEKIDKPIKIWPFVLT